MANAAPTPYSAFAVCASDGLALLMLLAPNTAPPPRARALAPAATQVQVRCRCGGSGGGGPLKVDTGLPAARLGSVRTGGGGAVPGEEVDPLEAPLPAGLVCAAASPLGEAAQGETGFATACPEEATLEVSFAGGGVGVATCAGGGATCAGGVATCAGGVLIGSAASGASFTPLGGFSRACFSLARRSSMSLMACSIVALFFASGLSRR